MTAADHIPEELADEILFRLPSKSLLRLKSACKRWYSSISDSDFINLHTEQASQNPKIIFSTGSHLCFLDNSSHPIPFPDETSPFHPLKIIGSCHGLVCLASSSATAANDPKNRIFIWNPSTRYLKIIPYWSPINLKHTYYLHGFAYDSVSNDYILFISVNSSSYYYFSFKFDSWTLCRTGIGFRPQRCQTPPTRPSTTLATELNGVLHWFITEKHCYRQGAEADIMTFDISTRKLAYMNSWNILLNVAPLLCSWWTSWLSVAGLFLYRGRLCLYCCPPESTTSKEIWIMETYGDNNSWVHFLTLPNYDSGFDFPNAPILCISSTDEVLLRDHQSFIRFRSKEGNFDQPIPVQPYVNRASFSALDTLVSPP
ncbi:F-box and associated interaction domains-containing protein [Euphorbia peplus]|nr:F-box and associated interaction domains-containing protein [Euphorbia peplus]